MTDLTADEGRSLELLAELARRKSFVRSAPAAAPQGILP
jgi:hypothetical protein